MILQKYADLMLNKPQKYIIIIVVIYHNFWQDLLLWCTWPYKSNKALKATVYSE